MFLYMIKRICGAIVVLWAVITITFGLMHAIPGGPFTEEKKLPPAVLANIEERGSLTLAIKEKRCEASKMAYFFVNFSIFFLSNV